MRSRVVPGIGLTIATSLLVKALIRVLFPTLGLPTMETLTPSLAVCRDLEEVITLLSFYNIFVTFYLDLTITV